MASVVYKIDGISREKVAEVSGLSEAHAYLSGLCIDPALAARMIFEPDPDHPECADALVFVSPVQLDHYAIETA